MVRPNKASCSSSLCRRCISIVLFVTKRGSKCSLVHRADCPRHCDHQRHSISPPSASAHLGRNDRGQFSWAVHSSALQRQPQRHLDRRSV
ncbi:hypothetical protein I7I53_10981 [Histoplasma capsulatum var. duboisii H88]|uniref:Uncharacterized protein n=1 Tax=Ajellomyces capsulatus (strain H88) TaxID=544711 RepID=A0A8A1L9N7_AJEC8|nr:hypothetical protein I7I53_10981 [Histoplasma capsulatum var. duboisii H88]